MADKPIHISLPITERIVPMKPPTEIITIEKWRNVIINNFPDTLIGAEIALSITAQLLINDITHPFGLVIIGPPSSGKTTTLNFFSDLDGVSYVTDKFTASAFVSHALNSKEADLAKNDLLPKIRRKVMIVRDFATVFSKRDDDLRETIGVMTRVLDGEGLKSDTGPHGERGYLGDYSFMFLAASTPIKKHTWQLMATLGSRLFYYQFPAREKTPFELAQQLSERSPKTKEEECRITTLELIRNLWRLHPTGVDWNRNEDPRDCLHIIVQCAQLLASGRSNPGTLKKDYPSTHAEEYEEPTVEQPDRVANLFYNIVRARALTNGRQQISRDDLWIVFRITLDSIPPMRASLLKEMIGNEGFLSTENIEKMFKSSKPTAAKYMRIMENLGICNIIASKDGVGHPKHGLVLNKKFQWLLAEDIRQLYKSCNYSK